MPLPSVDHRSQPKSQPPPPQQQDHHPCPRCDSTNTKFCYYNNYNFSQPRHFCKSCRRYWTHGGTLRDIPVGGGSRKNAKRSRTSTSLSDHSLPTTTTQFSAGGGNLAGGFTSLLNSSGYGFLALGGRFGFDGFWPVSGVSDGGAVNNGGNVWQLDGGGDGDFTAGDCFSWPELAISTHGNAMK